jgi:hypothetical protein
MNDFNLFVDPFIWRNFMIAMPIILKWTAWTVGCGKQISIGLNAFIGGNYLCFLSSPLIHHLHNKNIYLLAQASNHNVSTSQIVSIDSNQLKLIGELALEWDNFILAPRPNGISLNDLSDKIVWSWN